MKTIFFGSSEYVIPIIEALNKDYGLCLVITTDKNKSVDLFCKEKNIQFISIVELTEETVKTIENLKADVGIVADFGIIIPQIVLDIFPFGILNIHPSLLPFFRGSTPIQTALLEGARKTGVSIIKIDKEVDHGPILAQIEYEIKKEDNAQTLLFTLFKMGSDLLIANLQDYIGGSEKLIEQNHSKATSTKMLSKDNGLIDISNPPTFENLNNMVRAFFPWPGVWTKITVNENEERIIKFLPNKKILVEGKNPMNYKDFLNGYKNADKKFVEFLKNYEAVTTT